MILVYFAILALWALFLTTLGVTKGRIQPDAQLPYNDDSYVGFSISVVLAVLLYFRGALFGSSAKWYALVQSHTIIAYAGVALCVLGIAFAIASRVQAARIEEERLPFNPAAYTKYPVYAGVFVALVGSALVGGKPWMLIAVAATAYMLYRIAYVEGILPEYDIAGFSASFVSYIKNRVKTLKPLFRS